MRWADLKGKGEKLKMREAKEKKKCAKKMCARTDLTLQLDPLLLLLLELLPKLHHLHREVCLHRHQVRLELFHLEKKYPLAHCVCLQSPSICGKAIPLRYEEFFKSEKYKIQFS